MRNEAFPQLHSLPNAKRAPENPDARSREAADQPRPAANAFPSIEVVDVLVDFVDDRLLLFVEDLFVLLEKVVALRVDRNDHRPEVLHAHHPDRLGHAELLPVVLFDFFDLARGKDGAAARPHAVKGLVVAAARFRVGAHAAFADDDLDARVADEFALELFHAHGGRGTDGNHLVAASRLVAAGDHDGARVEDGLAREVHGERTVLLHETHVDVVARGDEITREVDDVADFDPFEIFVFDRRGEMMRFHSSTPL